MLQFEKDATDVRGTILFLKYKEKSINIVQIKKGFARGGHYHNFPSVHHLISGVIQYHETDIQTNQETIKTISAPAIISVPPMAAHLLIALEDTIFAEEFGNDYSATEYPRYRDTVKQKMS
ncbi:MAG: hypothetical protein EB150_01820 [Nitrososphaeria archaeon]|nr:hypothetical protein [Nitrososphaeria archaeon]NDB50748.1 hypothetical protein [Nitrosopumilaceae archaeon]NDB88263.1 hypothetical protein [Nitrososphaerota archaeon]NDB46118.1 hypothetical protein [Nitrososphaeria archaeon]NDB89904.1 hypothetical protein [Nitrososphaerota archaeon]